MDPVSRRWLLQAVTLAGSAVALGACTAVPASPLATGPVGDPTGFLRTRWRHDPWAFGSYSMLAVGATPADRATLASPAGPRLLLAGEATHSDFPATVHGALLSGERAARQVLDLDVESVVVVGAGMAGLAAAAALQSAGLTVIVVEARDRIGGRIRTDTSLGIPVDLGASWIHGQRDNPLSDLAEDVGAQRLGFDYDDLDVRDPFGGSRDALEATVEYALDLGGDPEDLSDEALEEGEEFGGDDALLPGGYAELLGALSSPDDLRLSWPVERVSHGADGVVLTGQDRSVRADAAIVTVPLGVLKQDVITFDPVLPPSHQAAVDRLGMGLLDKLVLRFDEPFWDADQAVIAVLPTPEKRHWLYWVNLVPVLGEPVLMGFNGGRAAKEVDDLDDDAAVADAMRVLRAAFRRGS